MRPVANWMASLRNWVYLLVFLVFGIGSGVLSANYAIYEGLLKSSTSIGPWKSYEEIDQDELNPYALAHTSLYGRLKLANFEALYFSARKDRDNKALTGSCEYVLAGKTFDTRWWSVTVYNQDGTLIENQADRYSFNNTNILLGKEGDFEITLSARARAGNWIPLKSNVPFFIMLRLYVPGTEAIRDAGKIAFPVIQRGKCL